MLNNKVYQTVKDLNTAEYEQIQDLFETIATDNLRSPDDSDSLIK